MDAKKACTSAIRSSLKIKLNETDEITILPLKEHPEATEEALQACRPPYPNARYLNQVTKGGLPTSRREHREHRDQQQQHHQQQQPMHHPATLPPPAMPSFGAMAAPSMQPAPSFFGAAATLPGLGAAGMAPPTGAPPPFGMAPAASLPGATQNTYPFGY